MNAVKNVAKLGLGLALTAALTACGSGPSESDVRKAFDTTLAEQKALIDDSLGPDVQKMLAGIMPEIEIISVKDCKPAEDDIYVCDVEAKISAAGKSATTVEAVPLQKNTSGQWQIID